MEPNAADQHVLVHISLSSGANTLHIRLKDDFGLAYDSSLPALGSTSEGLRVVSESWSTAHDRLTLSISARAGRTYRLSVWNPAQIVSVSGAKLAKVLDRRSDLVVEFPPSATDPVAHEMISIQFLK